MSNDTRNTKVVVCLILAMTAGARTLLWLEPGDRQEHAGMPLMAAGGLPVEDVLIEYTPPGEVPEPGWDCLILPSGECDWRAGGPHIRLVIKGSEGDQLSYAQQESLLAALGSMTLGRGGRLVRVELHPDADAGYNPELPDQARALGGLLVSKGIIE